MAQDFKTTFSKEEEDNLQHLADLLHLFNHRNKNQHRRSNWWRHFDIFRRQLKALIVEVHTLNDVPTTNLARAKKKSADRVLRQQIHQRLASWQDVVVPKWERAFSQVIADGRFAVLGVMLTAVLAEICQVTGITAHLEDLGQAEMEKALATFGEEWHGSESDLPKNSSRLTSRETTVKPSSRPIEDEDVGEAVERNIIPSDLETASLETAQVGVVKEALQGPDKGADDRVIKRPPPTLNKPATSKKRKKGDSTIDDLFAGLL